MTIQMQEDEMKKCMILMMIWMIIILTNCGIKPPSAENIRMSAVFGNHMVLQRDLKIPVWGKADPGGYVQVQFSDQIRGAAVAQDSTWSVDLKPVSAGGPYTLTVTGADTLSFQDVLVGEVWLCSGQSNMNWMVRNSNDAKEEMASADYENIRLCTVQQMVSDTPQFTFQGNWEVCTPETVGNFSAVGYFFGRYLHKHLNVPVGLIHSSWGGTPAEAWTSESTLLSDSLLKPIVTQWQERVVKNYPERMAEYQKLVEEIQKNNQSLNVYQVDSGNEGVERGWAESDYDDAGWRTCTLPGYWENWQDMRIDGAVWFRRTVSIPDSWSGQDLILSLGPIDDFDETYFNGVKVGETGEETPSFWTHPRKYTVPGDLVHDGEAVVAVRVFDHFGEGGFAGASSQMRLYPDAEDAEQEIELHGSWTFKIEQALDPSLVTGPGGGDLPPEPRGPGHPHTPAGLYNAMIHPLAPFAMRGAVWYQGEANAGRSWQYHTLLPAMIRDWRQLWQQNKYYFGIVQLANYMAVSEGPEESAWAELREAQAMTAEKLDHVGLAVIIDIGEADDIHPRNKQDVGKRLGLWARAQAYGQDVVYSGPVFESMRIQDGKAVVEFRHIADSLISRGSDELRGFTIAGADKEFVAAQAVIRGDRVLVWSEKIENPTAVRYAWANNPVCNLYNSAMLPAGPFRTDDWPGVTDGVLY